MTITDYDHCNHFFGNFVFFDKINAVCIHLHHQESLKRSAQLLQWVRAPKKTETQECRGNNAV